MLTYSSGLWPCDIEPGPQIAVGIFNSLLNNPPSVPNETLKVLLFPVKDFNKFTTSEFLDVVRDGYWFVTSIWIFAVGKSFK